MKTLKEVGDIIPLTPSSYVPIETLLQLNQNLKLAVHNYQVNIHNPNRNLHRISDTNITYVTYILLGHIQLLRAEEHNISDATTIVSAAIARGRTSTTTFPDAPFSDTSEETSPYEPPSV